MITSLYTLLKQIIKKTNVHNRKNSYTYIAVRFLFIVIL